MKAGDRRARREAAAAGGSLEVTDVTVLSAADEPLAAVGVPGGHGHDHDHDDGSEADEGTAADLFPGLKDTHEDLDEGWMARWIDRPTWDRRVTPNVIKRTGTRPTRPRR
jgi:hypothetical protein